MVTGPDEDAARFRGILALSADTPAELRACDVDRVLSAADYAGCLAAFVAWLFSDLPSSGPVARAVAEWTPGDE